MWHYLFMDEETGEEFFVEADSRSEATKEALRWFSDPTFEERMTPEQSEWYPYDVY